MRDGARNPALKLGLQYLDAFDQGILEANEAQISFCGQAHIDRPLHIVT